MNIEFRKDGKGRDIMCVGGATIMPKPFTDFGGSENNGYHHFNIEIPEDQVETVKAFGFSPYFLDGKDGKYDQKWILDIVLGYKFGDPGVYLVTYDNVKSRVRENELSDLDDLDNIAYADMQLSKHHWERNGRSGIKPYGSKLYIYLSGPSYSEQRYMERYENVAVERTPMPEPSQDFSIDENDDIPF